MPADRVTRRITIALAVALLAHAIYCLLHWSKGGRREGLGNKSPSDCAKRGKWYDEDQDKCRKAEQCKGTVSNGVCSARGGSPGGSPGGTGSTRYTWEKWAYSPRIADPAATSTGGWRCPADYQYYIGDDFEKSGRRELQCAETAEGQKALQEKIKDNIYNGCSTDGTKDSNVTFNPTDTDNGSNKCCQGKVLRTDSMGSQLDGPKWHCSHAFDKSRCCEGPPLPNGNCPGRGKTVVDGC